MNERACPYCGEECDGATVQNGQQVCCGFGCEHCCEVEPLTGLDCDGESFDPPSREVSDEK